MEKEFVVRLANLIMMQYYLASDLEIYDTDFSIKEAEIGQKALDECNGSTDILKTILDEYIKNNDWTGYLGSPNSGNRERSFAIEGFFEARGRDFIDNKFEENIKIKESEWNEPYSLAYNKKSFIITEDPMEDSYFEFEAKYLDEMKQIIPILNNMVDKNITIWDVERSDPFSDYSSHNWFFSEYEAQDYYDELCNNQGGRSSYSDDMGGMDYSINTIEKPFKEVLSTLYEEMPTEEFIDYIKSLSNKASLEERALEIGNGKVYAVQDAFYSKKTHDATGDRDIFIKNGDKDPNLTSIETDVAKKSIEVLKQMGKLSDISREYNVDHGPDLTYIPVEDTVKVTPDNGSQPYKIKIPEVLSFLKSYEYDILNEAVAVYSKADKCKKVLQEGFKMVETVSPADNKSFGYLENEVTIFKLK